MPEVADRLTTAIADALRDAGAPPREPEWPAWLACAEREGVLPLLSDAATRARWDARFVASLRPFVAAETALALIRERELTRVLAAFASRAVTPLVIKGAHLACAVYPS